MPTSTYIFIQDFRDRDGKMAVEQFLVLTRDEALDTIMQHDELVQVLELEWLNVAGGHFSDISEDLAREWLDRELERKGDILSSTIPAFVKQRTDWDERPSYTPRSDYAEHNTNFAASRGAV